MIQNSIAQPAQRSHVAGEKQFRNPNGQYEYIIVIELVGTDGDTHATGIERPRLVQLNF